MKKNCDNGPVTLRTVYEIVAPMDSRLRRVEVLVAVLTVIVAAPKVGAPGIPEVAAFLANLI
jgi:hypothetical protein